MLTLFHLFDDSFFCNRYKESISKFTRVVKEKQIARNITVKDLGREVQREMNASIAGVARMIERLDLTSKPTGVSVPLSSSPGVTSNLSYKGKDMQESQITESPDENAGENAHGIGSATSSCVKSTMPGQSEASLVQVCQSYSQNHLLSNHFSGVLLLCHQLS